MAFNTLFKTVKRTHKRLGRGHGSGRGKTSGRGTKGQKARGTIPPHFEGGQLSIMERLPYLRGKRRNISLQAKPEIVAVGKLGILPAKSEVTLDALKKAGIVQSSTTDVKILAGGKALTVSLRVAVPCSAGARTEIEKAGGSVS